ncbi:MULTISPECIES: hypothetical protein [Bacillus]|nr:MULTISPECIES: hypothetical protein [Bacillus]MDA1906529.1 hypothetical protein [Bacillus cereus]MDA2167270.1 hypothetical protein [Bacillus cereus]MDQ7235668.1 hypothetical protein [Bacillus pacificus]MDQ7240122.1 hypothetical protein [Bacillus pacificus]MED1304507.1 hypothetical protein [Bacillus pacificus]
MFKFHPILLILGFILFLYSVLFLMLSIAIPAQTDVKYVISI